MLHLPTPNSLLGLLGHQADDDTFYSQRVYDLFPQMATANSGWNTHMVDSNSVFGSWVSTDNVDDSDYIEWVVNVPAGSYTLSMLCLTNNGSPILDIKIDGGAAVDQLDMYTAAATRNTILVSDAFALTEGSHTIRLQKNGRNASSTGNQARIQHVQLIKQDAGSALASLDNAPIIIDIPVVFADSHTNFNTLTIGTNFMFGTYLISSGAQNDAVTFSFWAPKGAFTLAVLHSKSTDFGIATIVVDGTTLGTIDFYNGSLVHNNLDTSLSGTLAYTGMHTLTVTMATKNTSSTNYTGAVNHFQIRMTSITTAPSVQDSAPEVVYLWPVFAEANVGWSSLFVSANHAYRYTSWQATPAQNNEITLTTAARVLSGTYRFDLLGATGSNHGIGHLRLNDVEVGTFDYYEAITVFNRIHTVSGIPIPSVGPHSVVIRIATKNASSTDYQSRCILARLVRTGA